MRTASEINHTELESGCAFLVSLRKASPAEVCQARLDFNSVPMTKNYGHFAIVCYGCFT